MKQKTVFVCTECGNESPKWNGKCPACGAWNTLIEDTITVSSLKGGANAKTFVSASTPATLSNISTSEDARIHTGLAELDRVLEMCIRDRPDTDN